MFFWTHYWLKRFQLLVPDQRLTEIWRVSNQNILGGIIPLTVKPEEATTHSSSLLPPADRLPSLHLLFFVESPSVRHYYSRLAAESHYRRVIRDDSESRWGFLIWKTRTASINDKSDLITQFGRSPGRWRRDSSSSSSAGYDWAVQILLHYSYWGFPPSFCSFPKFLINFQWQESN